MTGNSRGARGDSNSRPRIAVVGGGLAGMSAAIACADAGAAVTLLEARKWLGGATSSFEREGLAVDTGQHVFLRCCTSYRAFLQRLGVAAQTHLQPMLDIPVLSPGRRPARLTRNGLPAPLHLGTSLVRYQRLSPSERLRAAFAALALRGVDPRDPAADSQTFGTWLASHGQKGRSVRALWDLIGLPTLNLPADEASLALAAMVFRTGLLERPDAADIGVPLVPLSDLHGRPALRALGDAGADVRLGAKVRKILAGGDVAEGVLTDDDTVEADSVIVAVPNDRAADLLPASAVPGQPFARLGSSPIVNVHVVYDRRVAEMSFAAAVDSPVQWVFDRTANAGLEEGQYLAVSLSGADPYIDRTVEDLRDQFVPALADLFPAAVGARVERFLVTRERDATFRQSPGTAALRPRPETRVKRLFLAGAWTDTGWPATMEGAVRSGIEAARMALLSVGRTDHLPRVEAA